MKVFPERISWGGLSQEHPRQLYQDPMNNAGLRQAGLGMLIIRTAVNRRPRRSGSPGLAFGSAQHAVGTVTSWDGDASASRI